ncbi:MAG: VWA domain-containing protein [Myxococcota bacterium]
MKPSTILPVLVGVALTSLLVSPVWAQDEEEPEEVFYNFDAMNLDGNLGATPGGAQDIAFFRDAVQREQVPLPQVFTAEGLFSEHDLPVAASIPCHQLLCVTGTSMEARLLVQPEVRYLAQLGFASGLSEKTFTRTPLHLVAVVDKSGSMGGRVDLVKQSLRAVVDQLGPDDQLTIVLYGDRSHVHLKPTRVTALLRGPILTAIDAIAIAGSTNMESGLALGFEVARASSPQFSGQTRVMLFTDERPNVGRTDASSFMSMARAASNDGIGMTTIGVGVQFGAELATQISSVRGGNLFFFSDSTRMTQVFQDEFDTMVTELAWDLNLLLKPIPGYRIAGVYGVPGDLLRWDKGGSIALSVETIFLSRRRGAIYIAVAPDSDHLPRAALVPGKPTVLVHLDYQSVDRQRHQQAMGLDLVAANQAGAGLQRGVMLVNQVTALKKATTLHHHDNDQDQAYRWVHALAQLYRANTDPELDPERSLVFALEATLAKLAGYEGEHRPKTLDPISGLPTGP